MINKKTTYTFNQIDNCNMCGAKLNYQKILGKRLNKSQGMSPKNIIGITTTICKCLKCGLIYSNPQPIPLNLQDHYGVPPENYWNEEYFSLDENYFQTEIETLKSIINFKDGMKTLDIGAGLGKQMLALSKAGFDSYGFEPSKPFYDRAISKMGINSEKLKIGMIENIDYKENQFDFISFGAVLEHLYNPSESILKALRWLKPKGIIHIEVPSSDWLTNKLINLFYKLSLTDYVGNISPMHGPYHLYEFGLNSFKIHAEQNSYKLEKYEYYVCKTYLPKIFDNIIKPYMKKTNSGMQLCVWIRKK